jgi:hypothetical protein
MTPSFVEESMKRSLEISNRLDKAGLKSSDGLFYNGKQSTIEITAGKSSMQLSNISTGLLMSAIVIGSIVYLKM